MKFAVLTAVVVAANLACALASDAAESAKQRERIVARPAPPPEPKKMPATRRMLIERMKASREYLRQLLPQYERKLAAQSAEVQNHRTRYEQNVISQGEFDSSQQTMTKTELKADRIRHRIGKDDVALSPVEGNARAEIGALRKPAPNVYEETPTVIRYNGATPWSPALIVKVAKFFHARFNKELPISAVGQSLTHDRLGYDHHIGMPSPRLRLIEAKQLAVEAVESVQTGRGG
jgi:hypothetical protein